MCGFPQPDQFENGNESFAGFFAVFLSNHSLIFDFHAAAVFDFFSALYFFKARRLFCLLRLCEFFRASCFMLILLCAGMNRRVVCGWELHTAKF
jgi:hypothetical protein